MDRSIRRAERSMSKTYLHYDPGQQLLLPAALREWLPGDHLAYFISDVVDQLDLSAVDLLLRRAGEVDDDEDRGYGKDKRGDELPEELAFQESRLRRIREAKAALEAGALVEAEQARAEGRNHPGVPDDKAQRNFTDPDSRIMPSPGGRDFQQSYNCQAVADRAHQVDRGGPGHRSALEQGSGREHD